MVEKFHPSLRALRSNVDEDEKGKSSVEDEDPPFDALREMTNTGNTNPLQCHLCPSKRINRSKLYFHYALSHFRQQILPLIDQSNMMCTICGLKKTKLATLVGHVGSVHNIVEGFLSEEHRLPRSTKGNFLNIPNSGLRSQDDEDSNRDQNVQSKRDMDDVDPRKSLECHICYSKQKSRSKLYGHYARRHYRENIEAMMGENKLECQFCKNIFSSVDNLIAHIGSTHSKEEEYLPARFRIERSKRGWFPDLESRISTDQECILEQVEDQDSSVEYRESTNDEIIPPLETSKEDQTDNQCHKKDNPESTFCGEKDTSVDYLTSHPDSLPDRFQSHSVDDSSFEKSDEDIEKDEEKSPPRMTDEKEIKEEKKMSEISSVRERFWSFIDDSESDSD